MKILLDENIPIPAAVILSDIGYDVVHASEVKLSGKSDEVVLGLAKKQKRIFITLDLDFSNIINYPPGSHPGVVVIRLKEQSIKKISALIADFISSISAKEIAGSLVILEEKEYRIRK